MLDILPFVERYGYPFLVALGFLEFAGAPTVVTPVLIAAGALVVLGALDPFLVVLAVAGGALLAEGGWFALARLYGRRLVGVACGLSAHPMGCVFAVGRRLHRAGAPFIVVGKFLPGVANLVAPVSGIARMHAGRFFALDGAALLLWATVYMVLGMLFADPVLRALLWIEAWVVPYLWPLLWTAAALLLAAVAWRLVKLRLHREAHRDLPDPFPGAGDEHRDEVVHG